VRILAVDTTTERASVAIADGAELLGELRLQLASGQTHSERLMPGVDFLLQSLSLPLASIGGYAVATGPGSFTGLRIGISSIQGLALGQPRPCLGVSTLDVLAERAKGAAPAIAAVMDAWRDEVYAQLYGADATPLAGPFAEAAASFARRVPRGAAYIGSGALRYREAIRAEDPGALFPERSLFLAGTLARLASPRLARGEGQDPDALRPLYVRDAGAVVQPAR
jgi:tRNA threonylcarbamoyladenosine biosynthesis protein TsaB